MKGLINSSVKDSGEIFNIFYSVLFYCIFFYLGCKGSKGEMRKRAIMTKEEKERVRETERETERQGYRGRNTHTQGERMNE